MSPAFYRAEAERCRRLANEQTDSKEKGRLLTLAAEYVALADDVERTEGKKRDA
jgi:hypothetical protein